MPDREVLLKILDVARWAPSGDNTQPWRFELVGDDRVLVHGHDTREWCVYDFRGHASHMAHGALLETLRIAASGHGCDASWRLLPGCPDSAPVYEVSVSRSERPADPLFPFIEDRVVQRRPMRTRPLSDDEMRMLAAAVGSEYRLQFFGSLRERIAVARLLWKSAYIRLTCPEAYEVHRRIIEWGARFSEDRIPEQAVGVDFLTARLMQWVLGSWRRVRFFNRYLAGTVLPRMQLDLLPGVRCAAHVALRPRKRLQEHPDYVHAGVALQRLWLTATSLGLHLQPQMTPVIFRWYCRAGASLSASAGLDARVGDLAGQFEALAGMHEHEPLSFFCRVGESSVPKSRSLRKAVRDLLSDGGR